jgi:hypothetical protein
MGEAEGIGKGGRATSGEDMDGAMADCGGRLFGQNVRCSTHCKTSGARHDLFGSVLRGRPMASQAACGW